MATTTKNPAKAVRLGMTGEQFKTLIERRTANGILDTIPELMERLGEIPDNMTLEEWIRQQAVVDEDTVRRIIDEIVDETAAEHGDIDEIFTEQDNQEEQI